MACSRLPTFCPSPSPPEATRTPIAEPLPETISISTISFPGSLLDKLTAIAEAGFTTVEIDEYDLLHFSGGVGEIKEYCERVGLKIGSFAARLECGGFLFDDSSQDAEEVKKEGLEQKALNRFESKLRLIDEMGTGLIVLGSNKSTGNSIGLSDRIVTDLHATADLAERHAKKVALKAIFWAPYLDTWQKAWELVKTVNHPNLGLCLDAFQIFAHPKDGYPRRYPTSNSIKHLYRILDDLKTIPSDKIFTLQLSDASLFPNQSIEDGAANHILLLSQGRLPLSEFLGTIVANGYCGPIILEVFNAENRTISNKAIALEARRGVLLTLSKVYEGLRGKSQYDNCFEGLRVDFPPSGIVEGLQFVEFGIEEAKRDAFGHWLEGLGLKQVGKHRARNIWLYRNGMGRAS